MLKIVIADDDKTIRAGIRAIIHSLGRGYETDASAPDGKTALERVIAWQPDVLITDIRMPVMDGIELVQTIAELGLPVKTVVLSGYDEFQYVKESLKAGVRDYLLKPVNKRDLVKLLERLESAKQVEALMAEQQEKLKRRAEESRLLRKERLLWDLIVNRLQHTPLFLERISEFQLDRFPSFLLAIIKIDEDPPADSLGLTDWGAWAGKLSEEAGWMDESLFSVQNGQMTLLLPAPAPASPERPAAAAPAPLLWLTGRMSEHAAGTFTAGASRPFETLAAAAQAYREAADSLRRAFYEGLGGCYLYTAGGPGFVPLQESELSAAALPLFQAVEALDASQARSTMQALLRRFIEQRTDPAELISGLTRLVRKWYARFEAAEEIAMADADCCLLQSIEHAPTAERLEDRLCESVYRLVLKMDARKAGKDNPVIASAKEFIRQHYRQNINLQTVAEQVHLNPNYFSNFFKQETGVNFLEYLLEIRMEAAKTLLGEPDVKIYEIGYLVGYDNPSSFNRAFKNVTGLTPSEYRKHAY
ncbi:MULTISPECIES: response regulator transcription factor [Paenibacillus]|uniref:response regulator transcription factor n=1 Tax=Paenibacillus TaxID=44249 RepID=UPI0022B92312|nr:response regulator [Paenibacillus caseinilyticus]MCZ8520863.1 response regulator [Paenibacillus caseinilyticus]